MLRCVVEATSPDDYKGRGNRSPKCSAVADMVRLRTIEERVWVQQGFEFCFVRPVNPFVMFGKN